MINELQFQKPLVSKADLICISCLIRYDNCLMDLGNGPIFQSRIIDWKEPFCSVPEASQLRRIFPLLY